MRPAVKKLKDIQKIINTRSKRKLSKRSIKDRIFLAFLEFLTGKVTKIRFERLSGLNTDDFELLITVSDKRYLNSRVRLSGMLLD